MQDGLNGSLALLTCLHFQIRLLLSNGSKFITHAQSSCAWVAPPGQPTKTNENQRYRETCQPTSMSIFLETLKT